MSEAVTHHFSAADGTRLAWHEIGKGRPLILVHGLFSSAHINWIKYGHAALLADAGYRVIMPDLRAHGESDAPHDPSAYPPDVLADDLLALIAHLDLRDYNLGGYSLGGRTVARALALGTTPGKAIIAGMGLEGLTHTQRRLDHFRNVFAHYGQHEHGSPEWMAEAFLKTTGGDPVALALVIETFVDTKMEVITALDVPIGVICGAEDDDNGSSAALAAALPRARYIEIPGNHMSTVTKPDLGRAIVEFLA